MSVEEKNGSLSASGDEYTQPSGSAEEPPKTWIARLKYLGPSVVISATIVGSGEIILTASLGAAVGYVMFWWVLLSCWCKSILQAELTRYVMLSGDTYVRSLNKVPGKMPGFKGKKFSWAVLLALIAFIPGLTGMGGLIGGAGLAVNLAFPQFDSIAVAASLAVLTIVLLWGGKYRRVEAVMVLFVITFTILTIVSAGLMQGTEYATTSDQLLSGFNFEFRVEYVILAMAAYGYTGVNAGEIAAYTYWCVEKGYPARIGAYQNSQKWTENAQGWLKVLRTDIWATLVILTCATIPFYLLGAGVLNATGQTPVGKEVISALSHMFTETLGGWSLWIFVIGAFCILYSSTVSAVAAQSRFIPDFLIELGVFNRDKIETRKSFIKWWGVIAPVIIFVLYLGFENPLLMVTIGAIGSALMLPVQGFVTLYLQAKRLPEELRPKRLAAWFLKVTFAFHLVMSLLIIYFVVLRKFI